jgi:hypothetical protein
LPRHLQLDPSQPAVAAEASEPMMTIRYKVVGGREGEELRATEADALESLEKVFDSYLQRGHHISHLENEYLIEDSGGNLVAMYELIQ